VLPPSANDDPGVTAVRPVLPRYVLRGVSGDLFGRSFPLLAATVVGRAPECGLPLDHSGLSRQHARLIPTHDGLQIEDLGSTNGTTVNGRRVLRAIAQPGDEIGFDQLRFRLTGSLQEAPATEGAPAPAAAPVKLGRPSWHWVALAGAVLLALVGFVLLR
jgi:pSer/pThr/pTyr-binding forkhead associated (FHA) protein